MTDIFKALSEESRLRILALLFQDELCVCEIEAILNLSQSNASRHLSSLRSCGILESYKKAQWTYYRINNQFAKENPELLVYLQRNVKTMPTYPEDVVAMQDCKCKDLCCDK